MGSPHTLVELESLAQDMARLEMDRDSCDVVFVVGRDEARVSGHSAVFGVRCAKFVDIVSNNTNNTLASQHQVQSSQSTSILGPYSQFQGLLSVNLNFVSSDGFIKFVHYVYTGQLDLAGGGVSPFDIMAISSIFGVESLTR